MEDWDLDFKVRNDLQLSPNNIMMQVNGLSDDEKDWLLATLMESLRNVTMDNVVLENVKLKNLTIRNSEIIDTEIVSTKIISSKVLHKNVLMQTIDGRKK